MAKFIELRQITGGIIMINVEQIVSFYAGEDHTVLWGAGDSSFCVKQTYAEVKKKIHDAM